MSRYQDLNAWNKAMDLAATVHELTKQFPRDERFGLVAQLRAAAISVPSNIAEGYGRWTRKDTRQFLYRARGSLYEVETQLRLAARFEYTEQGELESALESIASLAGCLQGLIRHLDSKIVR